jgi:predicted hydrocarbon binding protein
MTQQKVSAQARVSGNVAPAFPLALLQAVRSHDHPGEILEAEDITLSLPRRFGLTDVVITQMLRYEAAERAGRQVRLDDVLSLIRLVMRRPDAEPILAETGQRLARWRFRKASRAYVSLLHRAPHRFGTGAVRRIAKRTLRELRLGARIEVAKPYELRVTDPATVAIDSDAPACTLVTALLAEQILLYTGEQREVRHTACVARGETRCVWTG